MGYIYKITNDINGKVYIGMTTSENPIIRWKEHLSNYRTAWKRTKRPLYDAMNKYGLEHFHFEVIEETDKPIEREQYWIEKFHTYIGYNDCQGYNATLGGESHNTAFSSKEEIDKLESLFNSGNSCTKIAEIMDYNIATVVRKLKSLGYTIKSYRDGDKICQLDKNTKELINIFDSTRIAGQFLGDKRKNSHIHDALNKKRKTAYGYIWIYYDEYIKENNESTLLSLESV